MQQCLKGTQKLLPVVPQALFCGSSESEKQKHHPVNNKYFSKAVFRSCRPSQWGGNRGDNCGGTSRDPGKTLVHSRTRLNPCARCAVLCRMVQHSLSVKNVSCICSLNPTRTSTCIPDFLMVYDLLFRFYNGELEFSQNVSSKGKL